jgi:two-component sensor histidine kinase
MFQQMVRADIVLVDDIPENLMLLAGILKDAGHKVRTFLDGSFALKSIQSMPPDLIFLDVKMPGMDGYTVCKELKAREDLRKIPVIFISALDDISDKVKGFEAGGVDYIIKPFQAEEVLARLETHLTLHNLQNHLEALIEQRTLELQQEVAVRKRKEEQLRALLNDKNMLLQEVHHRTRNNMQVMSSLISLHASNVKEDYVINIFRNIKGWIDAMALVHMQLHHDDLTMVDLQDYTPELANKLFCDYGIDPQRVLLRCELDPVALSVDTAIPFAMVLNELLANALKHAFPDNREGELVIRLQVDKNDEKDLWIKDNGIGFPLGFDPYERTSIGAQLLNLITTAQLQGTLEFEKAARGITVHIHF